MLVSAKKKECKTISRLIFVRIWHLPLVPCRNDFHSDLHYFIRYHYGLSITSTPYETSQVGVVIARSKVRFPGSLSESFDDSFLEVNDFTMEVFEASTILS
jgi:hypothetical protein